MNLTIIITASKARIRKKLFIKKLRFKSIPIKTKNRTRKRSRNGRNSVKGAKFLPCSEIKTPAKKAAIVPGKPMLEKRYIATAAVKMVARIVSSEEGYLNKIFRNLESKNRLAIRSPAKIANVFAAEIIKSIIEIPETPLPNIIGRRKITGITKRS